MSDAESFLVEACPECDSCRISRRQQRDHPQSRGVGWYRCSNCETAFDEPVERPSNAAHDGPCAHLCTVRKAAAIGYPDARGTAVRIHSTEDVIVERGDHAIERDRAAADGGRRLRSERR